MSLMGLISGVLKRASERTRDQQQNLRLAAAELRKMQQEEEQQRERGSRP